MKTVFVFVALSIFIHSLLPIKKGSIKNATVVVSDGRVGGELIFIGHLVQVGNSYKLAVTGDLPFKLAKNNHVNFIEFHKDWLISVDGTRYEFSDARIWGYKE